MSGRIPVPDGDRPWTSNYPPLQEWLRKHGARCQWQVPYGNSGMRENGEAVPAAYIECYTIGRGSVIVVVQAKKMGWDVYSALPTNSIPETLADAERRCGLDPQEQG